MSSPGQARKATKVLTTARSRSEDAISTDVVPRLVM
jgi:hypothetical protein